jgi:uncharacterized membrane protein YfcA
LLHYLWLIPVGFGVGVYGTLIGAGGGFVLMPVLLLLYPSESANLLASISLAVVFLNAASGSAAYARMKRIDYRAGLMFAPATIPGAVGGAFLTALIPRRTFDLVFGILMIAGGAFLAIFPAHRERAPGDPARRAPRWGVRHELTDRRGTHYAFSFNPVLGILLSFFVGFVSSLLGIGGGIIHVPALSQLFSFPVHVATATSHFILTFMSLAGTIVHAAMGVFAHGANRALALGIGVIGGAQLGAFLSDRIRGVWIMRALALALCFAGVRVLIAGLG